MTHWTFFFGLLIASAVTLQAPGTASAVSLKAPGSGFPEMNIQATEVNVTKDEEEAFNKCTDGCDVYQRECRSRAPCLFRGKDGCIVLEFAALAKCQTIGSVCYLQCLSDATKATAALQRTSANSCSGDCSGAESDCERNTPCIAGKPKWLGGGCYVHSPQAIATCQASGAACQAVCVATHQ